MRAPRGSACAEPAWCCCQPTRSEDPALLHLGSLLRGGRGRGVERAHAPGAQRDDVAAAVKRARGSRGIDLVGLALAVGRAARILAVVALAVVALGARAAEACILTAGIRTALCREVATG